MRKIVEKDSTRLVCPNTFGLMICLNCCASYTVNHWAVLNSHVYFVLSMAPVIAALQCHVTLLWANRIFNTDRELQIHMHYLFLFKPH